MSENEKAVNGQGFRLVEEAEGKTFKVLEPWKVDGEEELLAGSDLLTKIKTINEQMKSMYKHIQSCTNPECGVEKIFNEIMETRRTSLLHLLKTEQYALYEAFYIQIALYNVAKGNEPLFRAALYAGMTISISLLADE